MVGLKISQEIFTVKIYILQLPQGITDIPSPFKGNLNNKLFSDNFSSTVFNQLPLDLQKMFHMEIGKDNRHNGMYLS